ncbi:MAG: PD40 domain-containing protein [Gemmataceae bacterium]|nr:PD40 domain-containing protein [Gemmataceae bacterium]
MPFRVVPFSSPTLPARVRVVRAATIGLGLGGLAALALSVGLLCSVDTASQKASPAATPTPTAEAVQLPGPTTLGELGVRVAYARVDASGRGILVIDEPDGTRTEVARAQGVFSGIAWSPDGTSLAFSFGPSAQEQNVYLVARDGSALRPLTSDGHSRRPTWTADGEAVLFSNGDAAARGGPLATVALGGADPRPLVADAQVDDPSVSPDGSLIAASYGPGSMALVTPASGAVQKVVQWLREAAPTYSSFSWSADGNALAGVIARGAALAVAVLTDHFTAQRQVGGAFLGAPPDPAWPHPSWSPDGSAVVVASAESGDILVMDADAPPSAMPSPDAMSPVRVLIPAPTGTKLAYPAIAPVQRPTQGNPNL